MCESREGKIVVHQGASMGWWIGQITGAGNSVNKMCGTPIVLQPITLLWVQKPEYRGSNTLFAGSFTEFDSVQEAMAFLKGRGVIANA